MYSKPYSKESNICSDQIGVLSNPASYNDYPEKIRRVRFFDEENKRYVVILTNNFELSAEDVALLYRYRWKIELFFRWIKQHLKIKAFTFEDLITVPPASIREIVSGVDKRQLALALRGANEDLRAQIFKAMSSRAVEMLKEDMEVLGPVRSREVAQAQQEILNLARRLEAEGKVVLKLETGDEMMA